MDSEELMITICLVTFFSCITITIVSLNILDYLSGCAT